MTTQEITERMRVLLDAALARHRGEITEDQYGQLVALGVDMPTRTRPVIRDHLTAMVRADDEAAGF